MSDKKLTATEVMIRLDEKILEVLRRLDSFDKVIVPRSELTIVINELREKHENNQKNIALVQKQNQEDMKRLQDDMRGMTLKLGTALGTIQVITALVMFVITNQ